MTNLEKIQSTAHNARKPNKKQALAQLEYIISNCNAPELSSHFQELYAFFDGTRPRKKPEACDLAWVTQAISVDKTRVVLNSMFVSDDGALVATDGRRVHLIERTDYPHGYLTAAGTPKDVAGTYLNFRNVIPAAFTFSGRMPELEHDFKTELSTCTAGGVEYAFQSKFIREALAGMVEPMIYTNDCEKHPVRISDGHRVAVLMPYRLR